MIPAFLRSLATILRQLIAQGRVVHCTEADAVELEMISGLAWEQVPLIFVTRTSDPPPACSTARHLSVADIAHGWLRMSKALADPRELYNGTMEQLSTPEERRRAAVCAELAVLAGSFTFPQPEGHMENVAAHGGSIEGAGVAWEFIIDKLAEEIDADPCTIRDLEVRHPMLEKYRRELEAMKC